MSTLRANKLESLDGKQWSPSQSVESVDALRAATFGSEVSELWLSGYYGVGTAGGGPLYRDSADTVSADNGGTVFVDGGGVRWKRPHATHVTASQFGAYGDGETDDTLRVQDGLNYCANQGVDFIFDQKEYLVSKNESLTGFPNNDQPCLLLRGASGVELSGKGGATLYVHTHAQGILELQQCSNVRVIGLSVVGPTDFPVLDGSTGRAEKGITTAGYHTAGFWGYYKNNSYDTSGNTGGGFGGEFPQYGGGTASTWGTWNGGFIGNVSYGILVHNECRNVRVQGCIATGFNFAGMSVGHRGNFFPTNLGYAESDNVVFEDCETYGCYSTGVNTLHVRGVRVVRTKMNNNGHPDADSATDEAHDPGYGYTARGDDNYSKDVVIRDCQASNNKRKGIDAHAVDGFIVENNYVSGNPVCGIFSAHSSATQLALNTIIKGNVLSGNSRGVSGVVGSIYVGGVSSSNTIGNIIIEGNLVQSSGDRAIRSRYMSNVSIIGNRVYGSTAESVNSHIECIAESSGSESNIMISNNFIFDSDDFMPRGIQTSYVKDSIVQGNKVVMTGGTSPNVGINIVSSNDVDIISNSVKLGAVGQPFAINQGNGSSYGNVSAGGGSPSTLYTSAPSIQRVVDSFSFSVTFNGTAAPAISNATAPDVVGAATSVATGVDISLSNLPPAVARYTASMQVTSADGIVHTPSANGDTFLYLRAVSGESVSIGMKAAGPASGHSQGSDFEAGTIAVTVFVS